MSKKVAIIDTIIGDKSVSQKNHFELVLGSHFEKFEIWDFHLISEKVDFGVIREADLVICSGSYYSVYEDLEWKNKFHEVMEFLLVNKKKTLATCFGAQFLAYHLGGVVEKNPRGFEFGPVQVKLTESGKNNEIFHGFDNEKYVFALHGDAILKLPSDADLLAFNDNSPVQAFRVGEILATQFHSDLPTERTRVILNEKKEKFLDIGVIRDLVHFEEMFADLNKNEDSHLILRRFLGLG